MKSLHWSLVLDKFLVAYLHVANAGGIACMEVSKT